MADDNTYRFLATPQECIDRADNLLKDAMEFYETPAEQSLDNAVHLAQAYSQLAIAKLAVRLEEQAT